MACGLQQRCKACGHSRDRPMLFTAKWAMFSAMRAPLPAFGKPLENGAASLRRQPVNAWARNAAVAVYDLYAGAGVSAFSQAHIHAGAGSSPGRSRTHFPIKSLTGYRWTAQQEVQRAQFAWVVGAVEFRGMLAAIMGGDFREKARLRLGWCGSLFHLRPPFRSQRAGGAPQQQQSVDCGDHHSTPARHGCPLPASKASIDANRAKALGVGFPHRPNLSRSAGGAAGSRRLAQSAPWDELTSSSGWNCWGSDAARRVSASCWDACSVLCCSVVVDCIGNVLRLSALRLPRLT